MSPSTGLSSHVSTFSSRFWLLTVPWIFHLFSAVKVTSWLFVPPLDCGLTTALCSCADFTKPCGVVQSIMARSLTAAGAGVAFVPATFHACMPLTTWICRCSPASGCPPPPRGGFSPCVRTISCRIVPVS